MAYTTFEIEQARLAFDGLSILQYNVRSIRKNSDNLLAYMSQFSFRYDVIAVTETWLKEGESVFIPGYKMLSLPRCSSTRGGGVPFCVKAGLGYCSFEVKKYSSEATEALFVKLQCGLIIGMIYHPPNSNVQKFISEMKTILVTNATNSPIVVCGDFNIDLFSDDSSDQNFVTYITIVITQSTCEHPKHKYEDHICHWITQDILVLKSKDSYYNRWKK